MSDSTINHLAIGRRISEYISKAHNARIRADAYRHFVQLIQENRGDFAKVWGHRMTDPRKKIEGEIFLQMLRAHAFSQFKVPASSPFPKDSRRFSSAPATYLQKKGSSVAISRASSVAAKHAFELLSLLEKNGNEKSKETQKKLVPPLLI